MVYQLTVYQDKNGWLPFDEWMESLDPTERQKIRMKIGRLALGNFCNCKSLDDGVLEVKINCGPGYRVYFALVGSNGILILFAGTKRTQQRDIQKAKKFLNDYKK